MSAEKEMYARILKVTMFINTEYPELSKYLLEIPETIPDINNPEMNMQVLKNYFNSLEQLLIKYVPNHNLELS
jgi:hypothetical protein